MTSAVGVVGAGYVGLTSAVCLADKGFDTVCVDTDRERVKRLSHGVAVIDEPQLDSLLSSGMSSDTLRFTHDYQAVADRDVVFVCVPTPPDAEGSADLSAVESCVDGLAEVLRPGAVVVVKSTVPVGTTRRLGARLSARGLVAVSNPEFLREGHAIHDFCHPDRVVIGATGDAETQRAADSVARLYEDEAGVILRMTPESAELAKYASNAFLAVKLSYVNSLAQLCAGVGADIDDVTDCMGADARIGSQFLAPGPGWGGSCLPKDTAALLHTGHAHGVPLHEVASARDTNQAQVGRIIETLRHMLARPFHELRITVLGLTFKAGTSDVRDSPALAVCDALQQSGAQVTAYDPRLESIDRAQLGVPTAGDPYVAVKDADAVLVLTEWPEFAELDWSCVGRRVAAGAVVVDTRNVLGTRLLDDAHMSYLGNGRADGY